MLVEIVEKGTKSDKQDQTTTAANYVLPYFLLPDANRAIVITVATGAGLELVWFEVRFGFWWFSRFEVQF